MTARRDFLAGGLALICVPGTARATPESVAEAVRAIVRGRPVRDGHVTLDVPPLVENGNAVPLTVAYDGPGRAVALHVFTERNPQPHVLHARFTEAAPLARVATRVKLADTQTVVALAELADGTIHATRAEVIVTLAACIETPS
jgi:sulfur-oxidizing protein SoxY